MSNKLRAFFDFLLDIAKIVAISLIIIIPIRYFVAQPFFVRGASMEPSYEQGDYLIVDQVSYRLGDPKRGDVIIFRFPDNTSQFFIKRIIGLPSETITIRGGSVSIRSQEFAEPLILQEPYIKSTTSNELEIILEDNEYFVMGDNRSASHDSRRWGPLPESFIIGKVYLRAWPFDKFGRILTPLYNGVF